jgi:hypothetical protein
MHERGPQKDIILTRRSSGSPLSRFAEGIPEAEDIPSEASSGGVHTGIIRRASSLAP